MTRHVFLASLIVMATFSSMPVLHAAELVMFDSPTCKWCKRWHHDIGPYYNKTAESKLAPLRIVLAKGPRPDDLKFIEAIRYTPTFVLIEENKEIGRITGYPGEDHFWGLLENLLKRLPETTKTTTKVTNHKEKRP